MGNAVEDGQVDRTVGSTTTTGIARKICAVDKGFGLSGHRLVKARAAFGGDAVPGAGSVSASHYY